MTTWGDVGLGKSKRFAGRDEQHLLDEVDAGDRFGHRVLHLDARVHLHEVEVALLVEQELHRAGVGVANGQRAIDGRLADCLVAVGIQVDRRRFLDQLLVAALD